MIGATRFERKEVPPDESPVGDCRDWMAMRKREPGKPPLLFVAGSCVFSRAGYSVALKRHEPQDASSGNLLLDRVVREPKGPVEPGATVVDAVYRDSTSDEHGTVTILPDGNQIRGHAWQTRRRRRARRGPAGYRRLPTPFLASSDTRRAKVPR